MNGLKKSYKAIRSSGPYYQADIPNIRIDYRGLTEYARAKGVLACNLSDEEKNLFILDGDMDTVRAKALFA